MAFDPNRQALIRFGGLHRGIFRGETAEWTRSGWVQRAPNPSPVARIHHAMATDLIRRRVVLFGGELVGTVSNETWEWDGANWNQRLPAVSPSPRSRHAMVYDSARQQVVLFGGSSGTALLSDTWTRDGVRWQQMQPATSPPPREWHVMAYDSVRQRTVLYGGNTLNRLADTWEWDGTNWIALRPSNNPGGLCLHAMAYDPTQQKVVLFGGLGNQQWSDQSWHWDGTNWSQQQVTAPSPRSGAAMAYDSASQTMVLFGGESIQGTFADTWLYGRLLPASSQALGAACPGRNGLPRLSSSIPFLGNPRFVLDLADARAFAPCFFGLSDGTQNLPLGGGCTLYLNQPMVTLLVAANFAGFATTSVAIPADPILRGGTLYAQAFVVDQNGPAFGFALSAALRVTVGD